MIAWITAHWLEVALILYGVGAAIVKLCPTIPDTGA